MNHFVSGAILMGFLTGGFFFLRFWRQTKEPLFFIFSVAFWLLAIERIPLAFFDPDSESRHFIYLIRLSAFVLILVGIIHKNSSRKT